MLSLICIITRDETKKRILGERENRDITICRNNGRKLFLTSRVAGIFRFSSILNSITYLKHSKKCFLRAPYRQDKKTLSVILTMKNIRNKLSLDHFVISLLHQIHHFHKKHTKKNFLFNASWTFNTRLVASFHFQNGIKIVSQQVW